VLAHPFYMCVSYHINVVQDRINNDLYDTKKEEKNGTDDTAGLE
jgi:hypothetical protein